MQQPCVLSANFGPYESYALVPIPILSACTAGPNLRLNFHGVVVGLRHTTGDAPVPGIAVPPLGEDGCVAL